MTEITIQYADSKSDISALVSLNRRAWENDFGTTEEKTANAQTPWENLSRGERWERGGPWLDSDTLSFHLQILKENGGTILRAQIAEEIVGELDLLFGITPKGEHYAHIAWMVIDPTKRQTDIETILLQHACQIAHEQHCQYISTIPENVKRTEFFQTRGFEIVDYEGEFTKKLNSRIKKPIKESQIQRIPLDWKQRIRIPLGFFPALGINYTVEYHWTYLRYMDQLYTLLNSDAPPPHLWLLRHNEAEALTVDSSILRIWLTKNSMNDSKFFTGIIEETEILSQKNGVSKLTVFALQTQFEFLQDHGYSLQQKRPILRFLL